MKAFRLMRRFTDVKDSNFTMIRRELYADGIQNILKFSAYYLSGSQAVKAELMRAAIDAMNHVVLLGANKRSKQIPDEHYNYGKTLQRLSKIQEHGCAFARILFRLFRSLQLNSPDYYFDEWFGTARIDFKSTFFRGITYSGYYLIKFWRILFVLQEPW